MPGLTMKCKIFEGFGLSFNALDNIISDVQITFKVQIGSMPVETFGFDLS